MVDQHDVDLLGRFGDVEDRITEPIHTGHVVPVELDFLPERTADSLDDGALDGVPQAIRIYDQSAIVRDREPAGPDSSGRAINLHFGDDRDARRAALRVGDTTAGDLVAALVRARCRPRLPS